MLYASTACPTVWFGDSGELIAAAACLGVAHPPGYPLWTALGRVFLSLPFGEPAYRLNLFSVAVASVSCGLAALLVFRATGSRLGAASAGVFLAVSSTFWSVATITEVYALHVLLGLWLLTAAQSLGRGGGGRALAGACAAFGLGLAHHPTIVLWVPAAAWLACRAPSGRRGFRLPARPGAILAAAAGSAAIALGCYGWMLLRARAGPPSNWGDPSTLDALRLHVTAAVYRHLDLGWRGIGRWEGWVRLGTVVARDLAWVGMIVGAAGLIRPGSRESARGLAGALSGLAVLSFLFALRYSVDDPEVFLLPTLTALAAGGGIAVSRLAERRRWAVVLPAAIVLASVASHGASRNLHGVGAALAYAHDVLRTVPQGAVLFVESDDAFPVLYATQVLGERPDLTIYHRRGYLFRDLTREVSPPVGAPSDWSRDRLRVEQSHLGSRLARDPGQEFFFLGWPGYDPPPVFRLQPIGLLWRLARADRPPFEPFAVWSEYHEREMREAADRSDDALPKAFAATYPLARAERAVFEGDAERAAAELDDAMRVAGPGSAIPVYVGTVWARAGNMERAAAAFRRAVEANPASLGGWNNLARALELLGDEAGAREARERSRRLEPGN